MKALTRALIIMSVGLFGLPALAADPSPALKALIAEASKEGKLELLWGANLLGGHEGAKEMGDGMNKMFGTKIAVRFTPGPNLNDVLNNIVIAAGAGRPSPTDLMLGSNLHASETFKRELAVKVDWQALLPGRIQAESVEADGQAIRVFTTLPGGIIYNTRHAPYAPTKLEDLLKPEWKGKIASTPYASGFDLMSATDMWGEERAFDYARKLTGQISGLIRCAELDRIASGEFLALVMDCLGREWLVEQRKGAPIQHVVPADMPMQSFYYLVVPKNSRNPAAAKLFTTFLHTPEGQKLIFKHTESDLHSYADGEMAKEVGRYTAKGVVFKQIVVSWYMAHPETVATQRKIIPILTGAAK
jgi:ABC-type Fe3+ transport system substrate-binding protein